MALHRLPFVLSILLLSVGDGCAKPLREVMLIVSTDIDCTVIDRVELLLARGTPDNRTFSQIYVRTECNVPTDTNLPRVPLSNGATLQLGVQDSRDSTDTLYVQVNGRLGTNLVLSTSSATSFVDGQVYGLPIALSSACVPVACPPGSTCRVQPDTGAPLCAQVFRSPGSPGLTPASVPDQ